MTRQSNGAKNLRLIALPPNPAPPLCPANVTGKNPRLNHRPRIGIALARGLPDYVDGSLRRDEGVGASADWRQRPLGRGSRDQGLVAPQVLNIVWLDMGLEL